MRDKKTLSERVALAALFAPLFTQGPAFADAPSEPPGPGVAAPASAASLASEPWATAPAPGGAAPGAAPTTPAPSPGWAAPAAAAGNDSPSPIAIARDVKDEIPNLAFAYTAHGVSKGTVGVQVYGMGVGSGGGGQRSFLGGGGSIWVSPIDRLTVIADGSRDFSGNFAPSAAGVVRVLGVPGDGFTLGALAKFKVEGFGTGPGGETESEIESGILLSYAKYGWHGDLNAVTGFGTGDDGEIDGEARLRLARDVGRRVRVGVDGQARYRAAGTHALLGGRKGDFAGGPQVLLGASSFYFSLTGGPATMGVQNDVGWTSLVSIGGTTL